ncbi:MAG: hypothetical protein ACJA01_004268 [Saprospiraceae bacterium]|jgi:hypothetical protein
MEELEFSNLIRSLKRKEYDIPNSNVLLNIQKELGIVRTEIVPMHFIRWIAAAMIILLLCNIYVLSTNSTTEISQAEMLISNYSLYSS